MGSPAPMKPRPPRRRPWMVGAAVGLALVALAGCVPMGPMGPGHMRRMMGRGMMGPGMMGGRLEPPPAVTVVPTATPGGPATVSYRRDIQPLFDAYCVACHGGQAGLWLTSYEHLMAGSRHGPVVIPGDPEASELVRRLTGASQPAMPLGGPPLPPDRIELVRRWIAEGAPKN